MQRYSIILTAFLTAMAIGTTGTQAQEVCNVTGLISTIFGTDGPLKNCNEGDVAHFQIDVALVPPATVAARYCDFDHQIFTDIPLEAGTGHLVCKYKWKWAKQVEMKKHPDAR